MARPVTLFTGQWADLPFAISQTAGGVGLRRPRARLLGRPLRRRRGRRRPDVLRGASAHCSTSTASSAGPSRTTSPASSSATRTTTRARRVRARRACDGDAGGQAAVGRRDDEGHGPRRAQPRRLGRQRLHRLTDLAPALLVPARRPRQMIEAGFKQLRRALEPDPRRLRRVRREVRPRGAPHRDRLRHLHGARALEAIGTARAFGFNFDPSHLTGRASTRVSSSASSPTASTTST